VDQPLRSYLRDVADVQWDLSRKKRRIMLELAEVVGLEEHLTVSSRGHAQLVDLWFAIKRSSVGLQWEALFTSIAQKSNMKLSSLGFFQPLPFTERRGWIVARCTDQRSIAPSAVEDLVRALVAEANERISSPANVMVPKARRSRQRDSWAEKVRTVVAGSSGLILGADLDGTRSAT
jgi:hypothetical protein